MNGNKPTTTYSTQGAQRGSAPPPPLRRNAVLDVESLKALRKSRGFTQAALARASRISREFLSGVERGVHEASLGVLSRLAGALAVPVEALLTWSGEARRTRELNRKLRDILDAHGGCLSPAELVALVLQAEVVDPAARAELLRRYRERGAALDDPLVGAWLRQRDREDQHR